MTLLYGVLWLAGVLVLALLVSRGAPLPARLLRFQESVHQAAYAMVVLLLACVAAGAVVALVVAATRGHVPETFAVIFLGLPNLAWLASPIGLGATWRGRRRGPFGLPMPASSTRCCAPRTSRRSTCAPWATTTAGCGGCRSSTRCCSWAPRS